MGQEFLTTMSTDWMIHGARKAVEDIQGDDDDTPDGVKLDLHGGLSHVAFTDILSTAVTTIAILDVSGCGLTSIPNSIDRLVNLQHLRIESNDLKALPRSMGSLKCLTRLKAFANQLSWLPTEFRRLKKLKVLRLGGNRIGNSGLGALAGMRSLEELYLRENESMKVIPHYIAKKRSLQILDVGENDIEKPQVEVTDGKIDMEEVRRYARENR